MPEVQCEGNVTVYSDVCLSHGEGNDNMYSHVCLRYSVRERLLCTVMCV